MSNCCVSWPNGHFQKLYDGCLSQCVGPVSQRVQLIWRSVISSITMACGRIGRSIRNRCRSPYPFIQPSASIEQLKRTYWGLQGNKWMECVDGRWHHLGQDVFDKGLHGHVVEPGFMSSMLKAFLVVEQQLGKTIDADWYLGLHRQTCSHFNDNTAVSVVGQSKVGVFRDLAHPIQASFFGVYLPSDGAVREFQALDREISGKFGSLYGLGTMVCVSASRVLLSYKPMTEAQVAKLFNWFLTTFYQEMEQAVCPDEKLIAIAKFHQRLEWLHPVADGTSRTSIALMNLLLTTYGFHPALLQYPHLSSSHSLAEWTADLRAGLVAWEAQANTIPKK